MPFPLFHLKGQDFAMIRSMTGYGRFEATKNGMDITGY